ncbi:c-type cytochrome [Xanthovirga aplysinae]|uniref:c-type cytochrome n=1 Tax=Xanthovirga aplysinae TaxID=2529853 RepID=UPI0012BC9118|nr:cytochrome c [Xanthovirga aplysinae]MTI30216.1 cytochrome c [Xanthovirga aplysinae]
MKTGIKKLCIKIMGGLALLSFPFLLNSCGSGSNGNETANQASASIKDVSTDPMQNKGVGPIIQVELGALDEQMVEDGKTIFEANCTACHRVGQRFIGPDLKGITNRRSPEWIMNILLNPEKMVKEDPIAKKLWAEFNGATMVNQNISEGKARKILEYFRTLK